MRMWWSVAVFFFLVIAERRSDFLVSGFWA